MDQSTPKLYALLIVLVAMYGLRRLGRIASSSLFFTSSGTPIVYFVCYSAYELERWALLLFWGLSSLSLRLVFLNLLHIFSRVLGLSLGLNFIFSARYCGLACDHGNSFLCLEE